ncbi:MAG: class I SAM-dependent methyltransferase [Chloroflexi bacterium]|nr:class I SAM-dependent methyltransferase [Chloroflexota bacterium]MCI0576668.1 class I SAM-dependent methyltransferase [Chloroflexota bacterium]MCI0647981.1 class I SAM-dependent methyltransferase [Chloroflexota bacterium]MCI0726809.1 class I SAM-dependent methyltransferase [Chloroflexota bacterium]
MVEVDPAAFDNFAGDYDASFTQSLLGKMWRRRVWRRLAKHFTAGQRVLELACGTGEDAVWLAQQGVQVTATDGSAEMIRIATEKAHQAGVDGRITAVQLALQELTTNHQPSTTNHQLFDGAFSNFGGLNTIGDWRPLAGALAEIVRPGGKLILVPMGPFCPWEIGWHLLHGQARVAFRRLGGRAKARIGPAAIPVWYPPAGRLRRDFAPWFRHLCTESLGLWLPPSYLEHLLKRWSGLFGRLNRLEEATARLTGGWGDHYLMVLERR